MAYMVNDILIENPTKSCMDRLRRIGVEKAKRLSKIQERWEKGEYKDIEVIRV